MRKVVLAVVLVLMAGGAQAVTLNVIGGQLMGATDVLVDGNLYDVQFLDGSCADLYGGCDAPSDFVFQTYEYAYLASVALLDQVFLDGPSGDFDTIPALTNLCLPLSTISACKVLTPFVSFHSSFPDYYSAPVTHRHRVMVASNAALESPAHYSDSIYNESLYDLHYDFAATHSAAAQRVVAVWSGLQVPEPSTALLLGLGLTGLSWSGGRRNRS